MPADSVGCVVTSPPCITPGGPWYPSSGTKRVTYTDAPGGVVVTETGSEIDAITPASAGSPRK